MDHEHYARSERAAGRDSAAGGDGPQGGRCPLYRLRLADPAPPVHAESVRRFDPAADQVERAWWALRMELFELLLAAGATSDHAEDGADAITGYTFRPAGSPAGWTVEDHRDGVRAVEAMLSWLADELADHGVDPNPAEADPAEWIAAVGDQWERTPLLDRPRLIAARVHAQLWDPAAR